MAAQSTSTLCAAVPASKLAPASFRRGGPHCRLAEGILLVSLPPCVSLSPPQQFKLTAQVHCPPLLLPAPSLTHHCRCYGVVLPFFDAVQRRVWKWMHAGEVGAAALVVWG